MTHTVARRHAGGCARAAHVANSCSDGRCPGAGCACGCCAGTATLTPAPIHNRPGLVALEYRVGTHGTFLASMKARLHDVTVESRRPLADLTTRDGGDMAIALLDGWASIADVLTFYQERISNEGFLRTATERHSVLELARLVGYRARPGVAASVYLAYTLDQGPAVDIPAGSRAQSVPGPGQTPQTFETREVLRASAELNVLGLRATKPQLVLPDELPDRLYLAGVVSSLRAGDTLLLHFVARDEPQLATVHEVRTDPAAGTTVLRLAALSALGAAPDDLLDAVGLVVEELTTFEAMGFPRGGARAELELLTALLRHSRADELRAELVDATLPRLEELHRRASATTHKGPWLRRVIDGLRRALAAEAVVSPVAVEPPAASQLSRLVAAVSKPASVPPAGRLRLANDPGKLYAGASDLMPRLFAALVPGSAQTVYSALASAPATTPPALGRIESLRVRAPLFGHNAPPIARFGEVEVILLSSGVQVVGYTDPVVAAYGGGDKGTTENTQLPGNAVDLDGVHEGIEAGSWIALQAGGVVDVRRVTAVRTLSVTGFGLSARVTRVSFDGDAWPNVPLGDARDVPTVVRGAVVHADGEPLTLAEEPLLGVANDVGGGDTGYLELDGVYPGLQPGRWVVVTGERTDPELLAALNKDPQGPSGDRAAAADGAGAESEEERSTGVHGAELALIAEVVNGFRGVETAFVPADEPEAALPGDTLHTFVRLASPLEYRYKRSSVKIHGNVVEATHGETKAEVLGGGDAREAFQTFTLKQPPLTFLAAPTAAGAESTLEVFVNDVAWAESDCFAGLGAGDRRYVVRIDDEGATSVVFGDGVTGSRLPSGQENVRARYRSGIGSPGNVAAGQISLLTSRPLGVTQVVNPLPATGGADREGRDEVRDNAPRYLRALDRLVSVSDYEDFARAFAGIGKAAAVELSDGQRQVVHVTIAGADDGPIAEHSDLYRNLRLALQQLGDPYYPVALALRDRKLLVVQARVRLLPEYRWESVEPRVREHLLEAFGFERRELGRSVARSAVLAAIQQVAGVDFADMDAFGALGMEELTVTDPSAHLTDTQVVRVRPARFERAPGVIVPAEIAYLDPGVPETLLLTELP